MYSMDVLEIPIVPLAFVGQRQVDVSVKVICWPAGSKVEDVNELRMRIVIELYIYCYKI